MPQKLNNGNATVNDDGSLTLGSGTLQGDEGGFAAVSFSVHKNGTNQVDIVDSTWTKLTWATKEYDVGGYFDLANNKHVPPAGKYTYILGTVIDSLGAKKTPQAAIYKNGAIVRRAQGEKVDAILSEYTLFITDVPVNGTDYIESFCWHNHGGNRDVNGNVELTIFQGHRIE